MSTWIRELTRADATRIADAVIGSEVDRESPDFKFDLEAALYWWAADHHSGQRSQLYSILSESPYRPGALENGPDPDSYVGMVYEAMCDEAGCDHELSPDA